MFWARAAILIDFLFYFLFFKGYQKSVIDTMVLQERLSQGLDPLAAYTYPFFLSFFSFCFACWSVVLSCLVLWYISHALSREGHITSGRIKIHQIIN